MTTPGAVRQLIGQLRRRRVVAHPDVESDFTLFCPTVIAGLT
jgi:hypothetical protein